MSQDHQKILIIGSGIAGPALAAFLFLSPATPKPHITILERSTVSRGHGQNIDIRGGGIPMIRKLGIEHAIRANTTGEEGVKIVDAAGGIWAQLAPDPSSKTHSPTADMEILRGRLAEILEARSRNLAEDEKVREDGGRLEFIRGDYLDTLQQDENKVHVRFAKSGEERSFDLVVGADGVQSLTRQMAFGQKGEPNRVKKLHMYSAFFSMPKSETDSAWRRWFHAPGGRSVMIRPSDQPDRSTAVMSVISEDKRFLDAALLGRSGRSEQQALLKAYYHNSGWECERLLREMENAEDFHYDLVAQIKMEGDKYSTGRVVLLGDAGYCSSPVSGMGTTLAMHGAYNLAGALAKHPESHTAAFAEYERLMNLIVAKAQKLVPGAPGIFGPQTWYAILALRTFAALISWIGLIRLLALFAAPARPVPVEEFGFRKVSEWEGYQREVKQG